MKTKFKLSNRILSLVLALVMVLGMMPMMSLTAYAATYNDDVYVLKVNSFESYWNYNGELSNSTQIDDIVDVDISVDANNQIVCSFKMKYKDSIGRPMTSTGSYTFTVENKSCTEAISYDFVASYNPSGGFHYKAEGKLTREARTEHTGGQNTCVAGAVCSVCGETYGTVDASAHNWGDWTYSEDGKHIRTCTLNSAHTESGNCDHKPASCLAASACSDCGHTYEAQKSHSYTYSADGNTITESCNNGCGHSETAKLEYATGNEEYSYNGLAIQPLKVTYSSGWQGGTLDIAYQNNIAVSTDVSKASGSITKNDETATLSFTITKATMSGISVNGYSGVYDGKEHSISITNVPSDATVKYSTSENGTYTTTNPTYTEKGTYEVWYKIEKENYETVSGSASVVISQATNDWTTDPSIAGWIYGENAKTPSVAAQFGTVKVEYRLATETDGDYTTDVPTEAGSYLVRFSVEGNENYTSLTEVVELEIAQVKLTVTADNKSKTYGESDPTLTWQITEGRLAGADALQNISISRVDGKDADSYVITVSQTEGSNPNYDITFEGGTFTINQKEIGISWGATEFLPYTGELIVPQATATGLESGDVCTLTTSVVETTEGAGIIPGRWHAKVTSLSNDNYCLPASGNLVEVEYGIVKGYVDAPVVSGIDETIKGKADGKINGLTTTMEYATEYTADDDKYTKVTDANMTFAAGTYYVRYQAAGYYNASPFTEVTIKDGRMLTVTVPQNQVGYILTVDKTAIDWQEDVTLTYTLKVGYTEISNFAVEVNGSPVTLTDGKYIVTDPETDIEITVQGIADTTAPVGEISIKENKWNSFWNDLTFGLFFKETQEVTITAADSGSGVKSIEYYLSNREMERDELRTVTDWQPYNGTFKIDPNNRYVIYARITDNAGYVIEINSDGIVLDNIVPTLEGIENGKTYYGDLTVIKSDEQYYDIKMVTLDGEPMSFEEGAYGLIPADNAEHTVVVEDHAGNETEYKITVYKNYTVTFTADGEPVSTETVGHGKDAALPAVPAKDGYVGKWNSDGKNIIEDTTISVVYTEIPVVKPDEVKPEDKTDLEDTKKQLEDMLKDDSYTDDDKKDIQDAINDIDDALKVIDNVEAVEELIDKIPDTIKKDDEAAIKAADDAYNALSDYEKSLVDADAKKALDDAKAALAELNKPADSTSPDTGDNSNLWLWVALLFVSGTGIFSVTLYDRKRRMANKR